MPTSRSRLPQGDRLGGRPACSHNGPGLPCFLPLHTLLGAGSMCCWCCADACLSSPRATSSLSACADACMPLWGAQNFDEVLVPADHVSRNPNDTYYVDADTVLRCHTSAHQAETLRRGRPAFLITGDVYRRDSIDQSHYPVFHQMEGAALRGTKA